MVRHGIFSFFKKQERQYMTDADLHKLRHSPTLTLGSVVLNNPCYIGPYIAEPRTNPDLERTQQTLEASPVPSFDPYPTHCIFAYYPSYSERPLYSRPNSSPRVNNVQKRPNSIKLVAPTPNTRAIRRRMPCPRRRHRYSDTSKHHEFWVIEEEEEEGAPLPVETTMDGDATPIISSSLEVNMLEERRVRFSRAVVEIRFPVDSFPDDQNNSKSEKISHLQDRKMSPPPFTHSKNRRSRISRLWGKY